MRSKYAGGGFQVRIKLGGPFLYVLSATLILSKSSRVLDAKSRLNRPISANLS